MTYIPLEKAKKFCTKSDIMIGRYGPPIFGIFSGIEGAYNVALMKAIPNEEKLDKEFFRWFLETDELVRFVEKTSKRAAGQDGVRKERLYAYPTPIPPLSEQQQIVALLDQAFEAIDQAKANIEKNIENAKELLESFKTTLLEKYASGNFVQFDSIVELNRGHNPPKKNFIYEPKEGYVRFYKIRDGWSDEYKVYVPDSTKLHRVEEDEMLMVAYRHIGKVFRGVNGAFNVALCKISNLNTNVLNNDYLFELIPSPFIKGELLKVSERSLIPSMSVKELAKLKVPLPSIERQLEIVEVLTSLNSNIGSIINKFEIKLDSLGELKKSILQKAFSGELTKKKVEV